ncbi:MAG: helix-turn-helix transcriptional regulator [Clostridia bacterium]|nr:helix-turn-helix transcriptional regulator [Clostridia bacterium]
MQIEFAVTNGFSSLFSDGVRHVKVLPYLSVVQSVEGCYDIALGRDALQSTGEGGFFVAPANVQQTIVHNADRASGRMTCRWIFLKVVVNGVYDLDEVYAFPTVLPCDVQVEMNAVFDVLFDTDDIAQKYICYYQIVRLLLSVATEKAHPLPSHIGDAMTFIRRHYTEKITVDDLAERANLSASHFFAVFKKQTGMSPIAYLNNYRLSLAVELLLDTDATVAEVAASVGIYDAVYFNKLFKKNYQLSPTEYRKRYKT